MSEKHRSMTRHFLRLLLFPLLGLPAALGSENQPAASPLGIGFLWTLQSQQVADKLSSENDFVDLILGPGKLDVFENVKSPARVACIARSLQKNDVRPFPGVEETIEILRKAEVAPDRVIIAYNPERQPGTPSQEIEELVASVQRARQMAQAYSAPLLVGPGPRVGQALRHLADSVAAAPAGSGDAQARRLGRIPRKSQANCRQPARRQPEGPHRCASRDHRRTRRVGNERSADR